MADLLLRRTHILQALEQANQHASTQWYLSMYAGDTQLLGLCTSDYSDDGKQIGRAYLFFRFPCYIRMPAGFAQHPRFRLGSWEETKEFAPSLAEKKELFVVIIDTMNTTFCVVCEDVRFHHNTAPAVPNAQRD